MLIPELKQRLLPWLRARFDAPALGFVGEPSLCEEGYETQIFFLELEGGPDELTGPLVLRLFRAHDEANRSTVEAALQTAVADLGFPAPRPRLLAKEDAPLGAPFLLMERLPGRGLGVRPRDMALTAAAAARLHALSPEPVQEALRRIGERVEDYRFPARLELLRRDMEAADLSSLYPAHDWLRAHQPDPRPGEVLCHGDLMMNNLLARGRRLTGVVDWSANRFQFAEREVEVATAAVTWIAFRPQIPAPLSSGVGQALGWLARRFEREYEKYAPLDGERLQYYGLWRCATILCQAATAAAGRPGRFRLDNERNLLTSPSVFRGYRDHFRRYTGVQVPLLTDAR